MNTEDRKSIYTITYSTEKCVPYVDKDGIPSCRTFDHWAKNAGCTCGKCEPPLQGLEDHSNCGIHFKYNSLRVTTGAIGYPTL